MKKQPSKNISRKEFLKKSSTGLVGAGIALNTPGSIFSAKEKRKLVTLGRSGLKVTPVGFGASRTQEPSLIMAAIDSGMNFIDTGRSYANGQNEVVVGKTVKDIRNSLVIQSKVRIRPPERGKALQTSEARKNIQSIMQASLNESLAALQTEYIDVWLIHGVDRVEILQHETVKEFFSNARDKGIIKACGFSTHSNQVPILQSANENLFYDVYMVTYIHQGSYVHMNSGRKDEFDKPGVEKELQKAFSKDIGIVGMKTCSAGPYAPEGDPNPTFGKAVQWVVKQPFVHTAAVAMANFEQIEEDTQVLRNG